MWFPDRVRHILLFVLIGVVGGVLSGLFGIGGGVVMVPMLVGWARLDQRRASATSLLAILPASIAGSVTYLLHGEIDVLAAIVVAVGAVVGSMIGTRLLKRINVTVLTWIFVAVLVIVAVRMALVTPARGEPLAFGIGVALGYLALGLVMGLASGLLGIGGGAIAVPGLVAIFGISDVIAKGTSLLVMIPTSLAGTIANHRNGIVDIRAGLVVGVAAAITAIPGALIAFALPARLSSLLFAVMLVLIAAQIAVRLERRRRAAR